MAVAELLNELAKDEYAGLADADIVARLNAWQTEYLPCPRYAMQNKFDSFLLWTRVKAARETIGEKLWQRWEALAEIVASNADARFMFDAEPLLIADLFEQLRQLGIIDQRELTWLLDLGRRQWTKARTIFPVDVTVEHVAAARNLKPLQEKIAARRAEVQVEHEAKLAQIQASHDELQKLDGQFRIIGDSKHVPAWERGK